MNYSEYCEHIKQTKDPLYQVEGDVPRCPPGYIFNKEKMDCVPKSKKDDIKGKLGDDKKDLKPGNTSFNVWGKTGVNGDGYAWEDRSNTSYSDDSITPEPR